MRRSSSRRPRPAPEKLGLPFTRWSLRKRAAYLGDNDVQVVAVRPERLRQILDRVTALGAAAASATEALGLAWAAGFAQQRDAIGRSGTALVAITDASPRARSM